MQYDYLLLGYHSFDKTVQCQSIRVKICDKLDLSIISIILTKLNHRHSTPLQVDALELLSLDFLL